MALNNIERLAKALNVPIEGFNKIRVNKYVC